MKKLNLLSSALLMLLITSCTENFSNGECIGVVTKFTNAGLIWKSHEGHLNVTQTGMNSSVPFDFSIDNDNPDPKVISTLDSAAQHGWKVKLTYHLVSGKNWCNNRGMTDYFITSCEVLEKNFANPFNGSVQNTITGKTVDTVYVVIDKSKY